MNHAPPGAEFAVSLIALTLSRGGYFVLKDLAANVIADADLYVPRKALDPRGEEFAVHVQWAAHEEEAVGMASLTTDEFADGGVPHYRAIVVGDGGVVYASAALKERMRYAPESLTVVALDESAEAARSVSHTDLLKALANLFSVDASGAVLWGLQPGQNVLDVLTPDEARAFVAFRAAHGIPNDPLT